MLSPAQIRKFEADGYLVVPELLPRAVLAAVEAEYHRLLEGLYAEWFAQGRVATAPDALDFRGKLREASRAGCDWFQPMDISLPGEEIAADTPFHFGPAVFDLLTAPEILDTVETLLGPELTSNPIQHVRIKPPVPELQKDEIRAHITATDWHQDRAVAHAEADDTDMVTVWIAMTDATEENGCLRVLPQGPGAEMLPHCPRRQTAIADGYIDTRRAVPLPVKAGSVILLHPLTPHASGMNQTDDIRWSFDLRYNVTGAPTGRAHFPEFIARSRANPDRELRDWRRWKASWEEARARLAGEQHIPIHRWAPGAPHCA